MTSSSLRSLTAIATSSCLVALSGCAFMPSSGPHASNIIEQAKQKHCPPLIDVSSREALSIADRIKRNHLTKENSLLSSLMSPVHVESKIGAGDQLRITIWSQGGGDAGSSSATGDVALQPSSHKMGVFSVDYAGNIDLPYAGWVHVGHLSPREAESAVKKRLDATNLFESVEVNIQPEVSHYQNIIVLGAVQKPTILSWNSGGIDLVESMAQAGGYQVGTPLQGADIGINITLSRKEKTYDIPLRLALSHSIPLQPGDRVIVQHRPSVRVYALGSGWTRPSMVPFDQVPTLSQVMASAQGLNYNTAQGRAIFVLKSDHSIIYRVNFDTADGMEVAQVLPIEDGDMVYVPVSRSTTLQQIMNMMMVVAGQGMSGASIR
ncbi:hypothetical protein GS535_10665 [Saccharibacter sp. EH611]|uniref:polysaccharide biosynthesis/export family protein n=2 Tax=Saccharibacter TaxID=231052 RepID=UPI0013258145|nr:polysaccharide biosynthesis/export family protein [Saccharibacter sp. EH611]MXV36998.1 hypothetical protein [Saccharibacter sp. EH611]MXV58512.1 hypothetical protein [Saccharibacter sp. EH70]